MQTSYFVHNGTYQMLKLGENNNDFEFGGSSTSLKSGDKKALRVNVNE